MENLIKKRIIIGVFVVLSFLTILSIGVAFYFYQDKPICEECNEVLSDVEEVSKEEENKFYVEIKGAVKKPGVYLATDSEIINDIIVKAGGLNKNAYTKNINLSKLLSKEMVIYVYTKSEYNKKSNSNKSNSNTPITINNCNTPTYDVGECITNKESVIVPSTEETPSVNNNESSDKPAMDTPTTQTTNIININTAGIKELTTLPGIGESKAQAIITYRTEHGNFTKIEDLKNVSGIGEATFEKLKSNITI